MWKKREKKYEKTGLHVGQLRRTDIASAEVLLTMKPLHIRCLSCNARLDLLTSYEPFGTTKLCRARLLT